MNTLSIPTDAFSLMWNGYATPYSNSGFDWMADAVYVCNQDILDDTILELVNDWIANRNILERPLYPGYEMPEHFVEYVQHEMKKVERKLAKYNIVIS